MKEVVQNILEASGRHPLGGQMLSEGPAWPLDWPKRHTYYFETEDQEPFFVEIGNGVVKTGAGTPALDWRGKDWHKCSRIWAARGVLRDVLLGEKDLIMEWHAGNWDFASRNSNSPYQNWFCILLRLGREQLSAEAARTFLEETGKE